MSYLFLAVPAFCGSTVLHNYLAKCEAVRPLIHGSVENIGIIEGHSVYHRDTNTTSPIPHELLMVSSMYEAIYKTSIDHRKIKKYWDLNWNSSPKTNATINLQKQPSDIFSVQQIQEVFQDLKWILMVKNPYVLAEGIIERFLTQATNPVEHIDKIVYHVIRCLYLQAENRAFLGDKCYSMTYEDFIDNEDLHTEALKKFIPELIDLSFKGEVNVKHKIMPGLVNTNEERITKLKMMPGAITRLNKYFVQHESIINSWGYALI